MVQEGLKNALITPPILPTLSVCGEVITALTHFFTPFRAVIKMADSWVLILCEQLLMTLCSKEL